MTTRAVLARKVSCEHSGLQRWFAIQATWDAIFAKFRKLARQTVGYFSRARLLAAGRAVCKLRGERAGVGRRATQQLADLEWEHQLEQACAIQQRLIPKKVTLDGLDVVISFDPCLAVGGDYADIVHMPDGRSLLVVGDVCGKGIQAALVAMSIHSMVHVLVSERHGVEEIVQRLNDYLCTYLPEGSFVTLACVAVDSVTGKTEMVRAGHLPALVVDASGEIRSLNTGVSWPLGIGDLVVRPESDALLPGELLALFSDGWTDQARKSGGTLGLAGLARYLSEVCDETHGISLERILDELKARLDSVRGSELFLDDRTLLMIRRWPVV